MNKFAILSVVTVLAATYFLVSSPSVDATLESQFNTFIGMYGRNYASEDERAFRLSVFQENMKEAEKLNKQSKTATFGITKFSDWTDEEFQVLLGDRVTYPSDYVEKYTDVVESEVGFSADHRQHFKPIQNQGSCGSCWTFAAAATFEAYSSINNNGVPKLSEQELVDCVTKCSGCNGGLANLAYDWLVDTKFIPLDKYPYHAANEVCKAQQLQDEGVANDRGSGLIVSGEDGILHRLGHEGPVSISIDASVWKTYTGGVLDSGCGMSTNHAVVVAAFENDAYIIRNSWGENWGENGFIRLAYGKNMCNIEKRPSYPVF